MPVDVVGPVAQRPAARQHQRLAVDAGLVAADVAAAGREAGGAPGDVALVLFLLGGERAVRARALVLARGGAGMRRGSYDAELGDGAFGSRTRGDEQVVLVSVVETADDRRDRWSCWCSRVNGASTLGPKLGLVWTVLPTGANVVSGRNAGGGRSHELKLKSVSGAQAFSSGNNDPI